MEREQEDNIRHQLDQDFNSLRSLLYAPDPFSTGSNSIPIGLNREDGPQPSTSMAPLETEDLDYDTHVRELAFDKRAQPKDRTKTEEELAFEEKEALEQAERSRRKRMLGYELDEVRDGGKGKGKRKRGRGGDDLDDDFPEEEEWSGLGAGLGAEAKADDSADEVSEGSEEDDEEENEETEDDSNSEAEQGEQTDLITASKPGTSTKPPKSQSLPFTFPCPETHEQFLEIVEDVDDNDIPTVVKRIRALYHPSLAPENKFKLQVLAYGTCVPHNLLTKYIDNHKGAHRSYLVHHVPALPTVQSFTVVPSTRVRPHKVLSDSICGILRRKSSH